MKKVTSKFFVVFLLLCVTASYMPTFAFAADEVANQPEEVVATEQAAKAATAGEENSTESESVPAETVEEENSEAVPAEEPAVEPAEPENTEDAVTETPSEEVQQETQQETTEEVIPEEQTEEETTIEEPFNASKSDYLAYDPLYIIKYADPELITLPEEISLDAFYKIPTAAKGIATYNVSKQSDFKVTGKNYIAGLTYEMPVYDVDPDGKYYVTIPNVNLFNDNFKAYDMMVAYNNDYAEMINGWKYRKGILYIPKSAVDNPKNDCEVKDGATIAVQLNYAIGGDMDFSKSIPVQILTDKEEPKQKTVHTSNIFDQTNLTVDTGVKGRKASDVKVLINGALIPIGSDAWTYHSDTGKIDVYIEPGIVSSINVVFARQTPLEKAKDKTVSALKSSLALEASADTKVDRDGMKAIKTKQGEEIVIDIDMSKMFVGWRGHYNASFMHGASDDKKDSMMALTGWEESVYYLYGGYTTTAGIPQGKTADKEMAPTWAFASYALAYNVGKKDSDTTLNANTKLTHWNSHDDENQTHTIYDWVQSIYADDLELSKQRWGGGGTADVNGLGGSNNFAISLPKKIYGATTNLVSRGENASKTNEDIKFDSEILTQRQKQSNTYVNDGDTKTLNNGNYNYWIAASCNHLDEAATDDPEAADNDVFVTCLGMSNDYVVLAFSQSNPKYSQNACAIYKFKVGSTGFARLKKTASNSDVLNHKEYSLAGAVYHLFTDAACTKRAKDADGKDIVLTTNANGETKIVKVTPNVTYYAKEITASPGFELDTNVNGGKGIKVTADNDEKHPATFSSTEKPKWAHVKLKKTPVKTYWDVVKECPDSYSLAGAVYYLYTDAACTKRATTSSGAAAVLTTTASGETNTLEMYPGTYYAKEITPSPGFMIDESVNDKKSIVLTLNNTTSAPYIVTSKEQPKKAHVYLVKEPAESTTDFLKEAPNNYSLEGAVYRLYTDPGCTQQALDFNGKPVELKTNAKGETGIVEMLPKTYYAKEVTASKGYRFDDVPKTVKLTLEHTKENPHKITSKEPPAFANVAIRLNKTSEKDGWRRLLNAEYKLSYYDLAPGTDLTGKTPKRSWIVKTTEKNVNKVENVAYINFATDALESGSSEPYIESGKRILPLGVFTIEEIKAPDGVSRDDTVYPGAIKQVSNGAEASLDFDGGPRIEQSLKDRIELDLWHLENPQGVNIVINKVDANTQKNLPQGADREHVKGSLAGAVYNIYYDDDRLSAPELVGTVTTDENGKARLSKREKGNEAFIGTALDPGTYLIEEVQASPGYTLDKFSTKEEQGVYENGRHWVRARVKEGQTETFEYIVKSDDGPHHTRISKTDITTGKELPGAKLQVLDSKGNIVESWISTNEPHDIVALHDEKQGLKDGKYTLREITAPYGYDVAEDVQFEVKSDKVENEVKMQNKPVTVGTTATDDKTKTHMGTYDTNEKVVDKVKVTGLYVGRTYKISGVMKDKATGESMKTPAGKEITAEHEFEATAEEMTIPLEFTVDSSQFTKETTTVAFEKLYRISKVHEVAEDVVPTELQKHEDIDDEEQTIHYGGIAKTTAVDKTSKSHNVLAAKNITVTDTVEYKNLSTKNEYILEGELYDKTTGKLTGIKSSTKFTPKAPNGTEEVDFTFDASALEGHTLVVYEKLKVIAKVDDKDTPIEIDKHENPDDEDQTVHIPRIRTTATNSANNEHIVMAKKDVVIKDVVKYENLIPNKEYTVKGKMVYKENGNDVVVDGKAVIAETKFTPKTYNGEVVLEFKFDATTIAGKKIVAFEEVWEEFLVGVHADINDEEQTIYIPKIGTKALDDKTKEHVASSEEEISVTDTVSYENLIPNKEYVMKGVLVSKKTGEPIKYNGADVTAETTFTPEKENGEVKLTFKADGRALSGDAAVAFEECYLGEELIAIHKQIEDEEQTVHIPKIATTAVDSETRDHIAYGDEEITIIDTVVYEHLTPGKEYTMSGVLMDKTAGVPIQVDGKEVTAEKKFTPKEANGSVDIEFTFDGSELRGKTTVAYEKVFYNDILLATHANIEDAAQTVFIPNIGTEANLSKADKEVEDLVTYENLKPGKYVMRGYLVDKKSGKTLKESQGETEFEIAEGDASSGEVTVILPVKEFKKLGGYELVAFEELYYECSDENGNVKEEIVCDHKDIEDEAQSVKIPKTPKTGDDYTFYLLMGAFVLSVGLYLSVRKLRRSTNK